MYAVGFSSYNYYCKSESETGLYIFNTKSGALKDRKTLFILSLKEFVDDIFLIPECRGRSIAWRPYRCQEDDEDS